MERNGSRLRARFIPLRRSGGPGWLLGLLGLVLCGCSPVPAQPPAPSATSTPPSPPAEPVAAVPAPAASPAPTLQTAPPLELAPFSAVRLHEGAVTSIALGKPPKIATFGAEPYLFDGKAWQVRPLPAAARAKTLAYAEIFFGRDNQPRLMGASGLAGETLEAFYYRHKVGGWTEEPSEIGALATTPGGLYGVLGYADPEVVCVPKSICLVKSLRGWKRMAAESAAERLFMTTEGVRVVRSGKLFGLTDASWSDLGPLTVDGVTPPAAVTSLCFESPTRLWVTVDGRVFLRDVDEGPGLVEQATGGLGFSALVCDGPRSVWAGGEKGVVRFDGTGWQRLDGEVLGVRAMIKGHDAILAGSEQGLFAMRATP